MPDNRGRFDNEERRKTAGRALIQHDLHGRVAHLLATAILRGDYAPETILPREAELMETFGVSRTVLREALRTLTSKGLIESRPRVGTRVRPREAWNLLDVDVLDWYSRVAEPMAFALKLQEMREMIEPYAAGLAAASHAPQTFAALDAAHAAMVAARFAFRRNWASSVRWWPHAMSTSGCGPICVFI
jgi:DNA-binding FadR family transcriptional regulator